MIKDPRYDYPVTAACKIIIVKHRAILFSKEPAGHTWMPGRWSLPGGKFLLTEGIREGISRKIADEVGVACQIKGLFKIVNIVMADRTVFHFVIVAKYSAGELSTNGHYSESLRWIPFAEVLQLNQDEVSEYYYKQVLREFIDASTKLIPLDIVLEQPSYQDKRIQAWMERGTTRELVKRGK